MWSWEGPYGLKLSVYKEFTFEAAHHLPTLFDADHANARLHGHSFRVRVWVSHLAETQVDLVMDLGEIQSRLSVIQNELDHQYLNKIDGLEQPTLEHICSWIFKRATSAIPEVSAVEVHRDTCNEGCRLEL